MWLSEHAKTAWYKLPTISEYHLSVQWVTLTFDLAFRSAIR